MGTPFPDLGSWLRLSSRRYFFFSFLVHFFSLFRGNMPKLILMLCLFGTTVLARKGFQGRLDVSNVTCSLRRYEQMDDWRCTDACKQFQWAACGNGVAYYCSRTWFGRHPVYGIGKGNGIGTCS